MKNLELNIRTLSLNPIVASETKKQLSEEYIPKREIEEYLGDVALTIYLISDLLKTYKKSLKGNKNRGYVLGNSLHLCYDGLHKLAYELDTRENTFKNTNNKINKIV